MADDRRALAAHIKERFLDLVQARRVQRRVLERIDPSQVRPFDLLGASWRRRVAPVCFVNLEFTF